MDWTTLVPAAVDGNAGTWRNTTQKPSAHWNAAVFDDSTWSSGPGGFGHKEGARIGTPWTSKDIWLRRTFEYDGRAMDAAFFIMHYDNGTQIYVNGKPVVAREGWNDAYEPFDATEALRAALVKGRNTIAVHTHQDEGGQFIDLALLIGRRE